MLVDIGVHCVERVSSRCPFAILVVKDVSERHPPMPSAHFVGNLSLFQIFDQGRTGDSENLRCLLRGQRLTPGRNGNRVTVLEHGERLIECFSYFVGDPDEIRADNPQ